MKSVVEARRGPPWRVVKEEDALEMKPLVSVWSWLHVFMVVVPKARENVLLPERSPPPSKGYVVEMVRVVGT